MGNRIHFAYWDRDQNEELARALHGCRFQLDLLIRHVAPLPDIHAFLKSAAERDALLRILIPDSEYLSNIEDSELVRQSASHQSLLKQLSTDPTPNVVVRSHRVWDAQTYLRVDDAIYTWIPGAPTNGLLRFDLRHGPSPLRQSLPRYFENVFLQSRDVVHKHSRVEHSLKVADLVRSVVERANDQDSAQRGYEFEKLALSLFESTPGLDVMSLPPDDQGFDILLWNAADSTTARPGPMIVEVKAWRQPVDARVINQLAHAAKERGIKTAIVFSATEASKSAIEAIRQQARSDIRILYLTPADILSTDSPEQFLRQKIDEVDLAG